MHRTGRACGPAPQLQINDIHSHVAQGHALRETFSATLVLPASRLASRRGFGRHDRPAPRAYCLPCQAKVQLVKRIALAHLTLETSDSKAVHLLLRDGQVCRGTRDLDRLSAKESVLVPIAEAE
jgi:hypothetical protein